MLRTSLKPDAATRPAVSFDFLFPRKTCLPSLFDHTGDGQYRDFRGPTLFQNSSTFIESGSGGEDVVNYEHSRAADFSPLGHRECPAHVAASLAACQACLDLGGTRSQQPTPSQGYSNHSTQVPGDLTGLVEPSLTLAGRMQRNGKHPVGLKSLPVRFIGGGEPHRQRPRKAWMAAVLELMNDFLHRVLKRGPGPRDVEAIQVSTARPAQRLFSGDGLRRECIAASAAKGRFNQFGAIPARLTNDSKPEIFDNALAQLASGGK